MFYFGNCDLFDDSRRRRGDGVYVPKVTLSQVQYDDYSCLLFYYIFIVVLFFSLLSHCIIKKTVS